MEKRRAPRLSQLALAVNSTTAVTGFKATIEEGYCNTDRHFRSGGRHFRREGKGRYGNQLVVRDERRREVLKHNSAETYRTNEEALRKVMTLLGWTEEQIRSVK